MSQTPNRFPGEVSTEGVVLDDRPAGEYPSALGGCRLVGGSFFLRDSIGVFNPRTGGWSEDQLVTQRSAGSVVVQRTAGHVIRV